MNERQRFEWEAELGKRILVWLNLIELRREEDRERMEMVKRVAEELRPGLALGCERAKRQAA